MRLYLTASIAAATLLVAGIACAHGEEAENKRADSHPETMRQTSHEEGSGHSHGGVGHSDWTSPEEAANRPNPVVATESSLERGEAVYRVNCVTCHGTGARGDGQLAAHLNPAPPDLVMMAPMHPAGDLAWKIESGRGAMPAWNDTLSDTQIWDLVNFLKSLAGDSDEGIMSHHDHESAASDSEAIAVIADQLYDALRAGDSDTVRTLLAPDVLIFESGNAEVSLEEYAGHHMPADMAFLATMDKTLLSRQVTAGMNMAVISSRSRLSGFYQDTKKDIVSTETLVLQQTEGGWQVVHVHWSSSP